MKRRRADYYLRRKLHISLNKHDRWKKIADLLSLSAKARQRLEWMIYYETFAKKNATLTCRHFGIQRSVWYYIRKRFDEKNLKTLEDQTCAPHKVRTREYTPLEYERIVGLRRTYIRYGKEKLSRIYNKQYPKDTPISTWKVQCIIERSGLYYQAKKQQRINRKRRRSQEKKRITQFKQRPKIGYLFCLDTVERYYNGKKKYILTAIDKYAKTAYARLYHSHSSLTAQDFLERLLYLVDGKIQNLQTDNGSEFLKHFEKACMMLNIPHYFSRVRTPQDNPNNERFNRTLQEEFIQLGNMTDDADLFNKRLTEWLIEYNFHRPHQSLDYLSPVEFTQKYGKVSKRYSSNTPP